MAVSSQIEPYREASEHNQSYMDKWSNGWWSAQHVFERQSSGFFDLGTEPILAFLTKFLTSYSHTLGMEEDENGNWIFRFKQDYMGKLWPTKDTIDILPKAMFGFNTAMDHLIKEFYADERRSVSCICDTW